MAKCIFISVGFSGKTEHQIQLEVGKAVKRFKEQHPEFADYKFITNYDYNGEKIEDKVKRRRVCLATAIIRMATCEGVLFVNNWPDYSGCRVERTYAEETDLPYYEIDV